MKKGLLLLISVYFLLSCSDDVNRVNSFAVATTEISWGGNLNNGTEVAQTEKVVLNGLLPDNAAAGTSFVKETTVYNDYADEYKLEVIYVRTSNSANEWEASAEIYDKSGKKLLNPDVNELPSAESVKFVYGPSGKLITPVQKDYKLYYWNQSLRFNINFAGIESSGTNEDLLITADENRKPEIVEGSLLIFDSIGNPHNLTVRFTMEDQPSNTWNYRFVIPEASGNLNQENCFGTVSFNADGSLYSVNPQNPAHVDFTPSTGAEPKSIKNDFGSSNKFNGLKQTSSPSVISAITQNGSDRK